MTTLTALPAAPSRADPTNFSARGDAMMTALETVFVPQMNTVIGELNTLATGITASVDVASAASTTATTQATNAANSAAAAAASVASTSIAWVSGTTYSIGDLRYSPITFATYRRKTAGAGTTDPSLDITNWGSALAVSGLTTTYTYTAFSGATIPNGSPGIRFNVPTTGLSTNGNVTLPDPASYPVNSIITLSSTDASSFVPQRVLNGSSMVGVVGGYSSNYFVAYQTNGISWSPVSGRSNRTAMAFQSVSGVAANLYYQRAATWKNKILHIATDYSTTSQYFLNTITSALTANTSSVYTSPVSYGYSSNAPVPAFMSDSLFGVMTCVGSATNYPTYYTYTYSGNTITYVSQTSWDTGAGTHGYPYGHARVSDTSAIVAYGSSTPQLCVLTFTTAGLSLAVGTRFAGPTTNAPAAASTYYIHMFDATNGCVLSNGNGSAYIRISPFTVSGTTLTFPTSWTDVHTSLTGSWYTTAKLSSNRVAVLFNNSADSNYLSVKVLTLSGTSISSTGSVTRISTDTVMGTLLPTPAGTYCYVNGFVYKLTITGNTVVVGSAIIFSGTVPATESSGVANTIISSVDSNYNYLAVQTNGSSPPSGFSQLNEVPV